MPLKDPEKQKEYQRKWNEEHRKELREYNKKYFQTKGKKLRSILLMLIGSECLFCGSTEGLQFHEIHGKKHLTGINGFYYYLDHLTDFIPICHSHHKRIHRRILNLRKHVKYLNKL